jgi:transposase
MEVLHPRCAGLDVHRDSVVACARVVDHGHVEHLVETFGTTTSELERLSRWLAGHGVTHVAMEAAGVYWKPVWAVLADAYELVLANAMHVKNVPGRKTDTNDAMWLADLLAHGLIRASFVPPLAIQALRDLTRARKQLTREKASHVERIDKLLQAANLKLGSVLPDIMGASGRGPGRCPEPSTRWPRGRPPLNASRAGSGPASGPPTPRSSRPSGAGCRTTSACCSGSTSARRMPSTPPSPRSTPSWATASSPSATPPRG